MKIEPSNLSDTDSYDCLYHDTGVERVLLDLREKGHDDLRGKLLERRLERLSASSIGSIQSVGATIPRPAGLLSSMPRSGST